MAVQIIWTMETTAKLRRVYLLLVDASDGYTPELGETDGQPKLSINGAAFANTSATLVTIGNGNYYVELTAAECADAGRGIIHYDSGNVRDYNDIIFFSILNPFDPKFSQLYPMVDDIRTELARAAQESATELPTIPAPGD